MWRIIAVCLTGALTWTASAGAAQQGSKKIGEKTAQEWIGLLQMEAATQKRLAILLVLELFEPVDYGIIITAVAGTLKDDKDDEVRTAAAQLLGRLGPQAKETSAVKAAKALTAALAKDDTPGVRRAAAKALGGKMTIFADDAVPVLANALKDQDAGTRSAAAAALKDYGKDALDEMPKILDAMKDTKLDHVTRYYCLQILTQNSKDAAKLVPVLIAVVNEKDVNITLRRAAVDGLAGFFRDAQAATNDLLGILKDDKAPLLLRQSAAAALAKIQPDSGKVWPTLHQLMKHEDAAMRTQAIYLAGKLCKFEKDFIPALIERCKDDNMETQVAAVQELGELGTAARAAEKLVKELADNSPRQTVREAANAALKKIQGIADQ